ncbi:AbrB/MazE/SpoVT family DNA-binding domain-containing protein [Pseudomonadota bacterium]
MNNIKEVRKITRGYQFTLPSEFRIENNIKEGDYIEVRSEDGRLIIEPVSFKKKDPIENLKTLFASQTKDKYFDSKSERED